MISLTHRSSASHNQPHPNAAAISYYSIKSLFDDVQGLACIGMHLLEALALQADCDPSAELLATLEIPSSSEHAPIPAPLNI